jgi:hypothetical protein
VPGFNGMGPMGMGPMTGGGRGFCGPYGARAPWRRPYGVRRWEGYSPYVPTRQQELDSLKDEAEALRRTLEEIEARMKQFEGEGK